jgi:hypothetical protein
MYFLVFETEVITSYIMGQREYYISKTIIKTV